MCAGKYGLLDIAAIKCWIPKMKFMKLATGWLHHICIVFDNYVALKKLNEVMMMVHFV